MAVSVRFFPVNPGSRASPEPQDGPASVATADPWWLPLWETSSFSTEHSCWSQSLLSCWQVSKALRVLHLFALSGAHCCCCFGFFGFFRSILKSHKFIYLNFFYCCSVIIVPTPPHYSPLPYPSPTTHIQSPLCCLCPWVLYRHSLT